MTFTTGGAGRELGRSGHRAPDSVVRRRAARLVTILAVAAFGVVWWGLDRTPADPTRPLALHGTVQHAELPGPTLRVATFNIHSGKGWDGVQDLDRTAVYLRDFDIVGLNEVRSARFGRFDSQADALGQRLDMAAVFVPGERRFWHDHFGNGLLTRVALGAVQRIPLPATAGKGFRNAVLTRFRFAERDVNLLVVHLNLSHGRETQLRSVTELFLSLAAPAILMGDLNTKAGDPLLADLVAGARDAVAEGSREHDSIPRKDWILTRGFRTAWADVVPNDASDHPCLQAELELLD